MQSNSHFITSSQQTIHQQLARVVARHAGTPFLKPVAAYNRAAFDASMAAWQRAGQRPLILDAGCGVGMSTRHLAARFPTHFVIGVDQSADRLARKVVWEQDGSEPDNYLLVRADLVDYWRLMLAAGVRPERHYVLYPNPWPKIGHLARRWHGHAVFPTVVALGGVLEVRSNWQIYVQEWAAALTQLTGQAQPYLAQPYSTDAPITPFERKYLASGHSLWRCQANIFQTDTATLLPLQQQDADM